MAQNATGRNGNRPLTFLITDIFRGLRFRMAGYCQIRLVFGHDKGRTLSTGRSSSAMLAEGCSVPSIVVKTGKL